VPPRTGATPIDRHEYKERPKNQPEKRKISQKNEKSENLPKAILCNSIENSLILPHRGSASNSHIRKRLATASNNLWQIPPHMPALPKKNRHNGNLAAPKRNLRGNSSRQIRRHQLKKSQRNRPGIPARSGQLRREAGKRLSPSRIARAVPKQNDSVRPHHAVSRKSTTR
jgi:hypothetical protein